MEKLSRALETLRVLQSGEAEARGSAKKRVVEPSREKALAASLVAEQLNSVVVKAHADYAKTFSQAVEALFALAGDEVGDVRTRAEEALGAVFRRLLCEGNATRVHVELYRELKRNADRRSVRLALELFADLAHLVRPSKARMFAMSLVGPLKELGRRSEQLLCDAVGRSADKLLPVLGPFFTDEELKSLTESLLDHLGSQKFHHRHSTAILLAQLAANARRPRPAALFLLRELTQLIVPFSPSQTAEQTQGVLIALRLLFPLLRAQADASSANVRRDLKASRSTADRLKLSPALDIPTADLLRVLELGLRLGLSENPTKATAGLELLNAILASPPRQLREALLDPKGPGPSGLQGDRSEPSKASRPSLPPPAFNSGRHSRKASMDGRVSGMASKVGSETNLTSIIGDAPVALLSEDTPPIFPSPTPPSAEEEPAARPDPTSPAGRVVNMASDHPLDTSDREAQDEADLSDSDEDPSSALGAEYRALGPLEVSDEGESWREDTPLMSPTGDQSFFADLDEWEPAGLLAEHCGRVLASRFLLSRGGLMPDDAKEKDVPWARRAHKRLAISALASLCLLHPAVLLATTESQGLWEVLGFAGHEDQGLRSATASLAIAFASRSPDPSPERTEAEDIVQRLLRDRDVVKDCVEALDKAQAMHRFLLSDRRALALEILQLSLHSLTARSNYVPRMRVAELIAGLDFDSVRQAQRELTGGAAGLEEQVWDVFLGRVLSDETEKAREAAVKLLPQLVTRMSPETKQSDLEALWRRGSSANQPLLEDFPAVHSLAWPYSAPASSQPAPSALASTVRRLVHLLTSATKPHQVAGAVEGLLELSLHWPPTVAKGAWGLEFGSGTEGCTGFLAHLFHLLPSTSNSADYAKLLRLLGVLFAAQAQREMDLPRQKSDKWALLFHIGTRNIAGELLMHCLRLLNLYWNVVNGTTPAPLATSVIPGAPSQAVRNMANTLTPGKGSSGAASPVPPPPSNKQRQGDCSTVPHMMALWEKLRASHDSWRMKLGGEERFVGVLAGALECLGQVLEVAGLGEVAGLAEEMLVYLASAMGPAPTESVAAVTQLLKALFGTNLCLTAAQPPSAASFTPTGRAAAQPKWAGSFSEALGLGLGRCEEASGRMGKHLGWLASRGDKHVLSLLRNAQSKAALTNYIRFFEPVVVQSLKLYTSSVGAGLQKAVLGLVSGLVCVRVNYTLLDTDLKFRDFLFTQLELVSEDKFRGAGALVPALMSFLLALSYEKKGETPIVDLTRIRSLAEGLAASSQDFATIVLPVFHTLVCDFFAVRPAETAELAAQQETLLSFIWKYYLGEAGAQSLLALVLAKLRASDDVAWRRYSRETADGLLGLVRAGGAEWAGSWEGLSASLRLVEVTAESAFRPADELLRTLARGPPPEAATEQGAAEDWVAGRVLCLWALLLHSKEDAFRARLTALPNLPHPAFPIDQSDQPSLGLFLLHFTLHLASFVANFSESRLLSSSLNWMLNFLLHLVEQGGWPETKSEVEGLVESLVDEEDSFVGLVEREPSLVLLWQRVLVSSGSRRLPPGLDVLLRSWRSDLADAAVASIVLSHPSPELKRLLLEKESKALFCRCHIPGVSSLLKETPQSFSELLAALPELRELKSFRGLVGVLSSAPADECGGVLVQSMALLSGSRRPWSLLRLPLAARLLAGLARRSASVLLRQKTPLASPSQAELSRVMESLDCGLRNRYPDLEAELERLQRHWYPDSPLPEVWSELIPSGTKFNSLKLVQLIQRCCAERGLLGAPAVAEVLGGRTAEEVAEILSQAEAEPALLLASVLHSRALEAEDEGSGAALLQGTRVALFRRLAQATAATFHPSLLSAAALVSADQCLSDSELLALSRLLAVLPSVPLQDLSLGQVLESLRALGQLLCHQRLGEWLQTSTVAHGLTLELQTLSFVFRVIECRLSPWELSEVHQTLGTLPFDLPRQRDEDAALFEVAWRQMAGLLSWLGPGEAELRGAAWHKSATWLVRDVVLAVGRLGGVRSLCRAPRSALADWRPEARWEERPNGELCLGLPSPPVHLLQIPDVLRDFVREMLGRGWVERSELEEMQCALQGVFSATPVGTGELEKMSGSEVSERVEASALAVDAMSGLLLLSLLSPSPGNPISSAYLLKHRERQPIFISSKRGAKIRRLKTRLGQVERRLGFALGQRPKSGIGHLQGPHQRWLDVCGGNPERLGTAGQLGLGQLSVEALWSLTGTLELEKEILNRPPSPPPTTEPTSTPVKIFESASKIKDQMMGMLGGSPSGSSEAIDPLRAMQQEPAKVDGQGSLSDEEEARKPPTPEQPAEPAPPVELAETGRMARSVSGYVLGTNSALDLVSALHFLLDMYSHWVSEGADSVPMPLLLATVRSLVLVSDLFTERQQFAWMRERLREIWACGRGQEDELLLPHVVLGLMKSAAVLGTEDAEGQKEMDALKDAGLTSEMLPVRLFTLHGLMYLLQSLGSDESWSLLPPLVDFLGMEMEGSLACTDFSAVLSRQQSLDYQLVLWSLAFHITDSFQDPYSRQNFVPKFLEQCQRAFRCPTLSLRTVRAVEVGLETLLRGTAIDGGQRAAIGGLASSLLQHPPHTPLHSVLALALSLSHTYTLDEGPGKAREPKLHAMEQLTHLFAKVCGGSWVESAAVGAVVGTFLQDSFYPGDVLNRLISEILAPSQAHPRLLFRALRSCFGTLWGVEKKETVCDYSLGSLPSLAYARQPPASALPALRPVNLLSGFLAGAAEPSLPLAELFPLLLGRLRGRAGLDGELFLLVFQAFNASLDDGAQAKSLEALVRKAADASAPDSALRTVVQRLQALAAANPLGPLGL